MRRWGLGIVMVLVAVAGPPAALAADHSVTIQGFAFRPDRLEIAVGDSVTWQNLDGPPHTVTAEDGSFDSGTLNTTDTFTHTFNAPGEFPYICEFHSNMHGTILVRGAAPAPTTTTTAAPPPEEPPPATDPPPETTSPPPPTTAPPTTTTAAEDASSATTSTSETTTVTAAPTTSTTELAATRAGADEEGGGGGGLLAGIAALMLLAVAAGGVGWWRFRRQPVT